MATTNQELRNNLIRARLSGAKQITIDGHTIQLRDQKDLDVLIGELGQDDLTSKINNTARPSFFIETYLGGLDG